MLAEWESRYVHGIALRKTPLGKLRQYYSWNERAWPKQAYWMTFVSNCDKNAWDGTQNEQFGECLDSAIVLSVLGEGLPLIHNGQEAGETKRLQFFERDPIDWQPHYIGKLYRQLLMLRKRLTALHNGECGATMLQVLMNHNDKVFAFVCRNNEHAVLVVLNFSDEALAINMQSDLIHGVWQEWILPSATEQFAAGMTAKINQPLNINAWRYKVFIQQTP